MALNPTKYRKIEKLLKDGYAQRDIARALKLSITTVNKYCKAIASTLEEKIERRNKVKNLSAKLRPKVKEEPLAKIEAPKDLTVEEFEAKQREIKYNAMTAFNNMLLELNERIRTMDDTDFKNTLIEVWEKIK
jgi:hypothetical protein|nr:MAG TPA: ECF sigma factor [Caudoviricetes sp.]